MTQFIHIEVAEELFDRVNKAAMAEGITLSEFCIRAFESDVVARYGEQVIERILRPGDTP